MGQALYRKYRTKTFSETIGQEHITKTLARAIKKGKISHAYLLTGPKGVGKTSVARILAHEINGLPYDDTVYLDIIEIDAASNRRIDEIRDLRDKVNVAPAHAKYKVYIIDEVHMLTKEAFNALLKTLEEPPAHVVFILATTEAYKLPETIVSRTQRYTFRPVPLTLVVEHLKTIAAQEKIGIDDDALELIAEHGEGSFRDSISLLDQAANSGDHVTRADIERVLGLAPIEYIEQLRTATTTGNSADIVSNLDNLYSQGLEPAMIASQLSAQERAVVLQGTSPDPASSLELLKSLLAIPADRNPKQMLEVVLLQRVYRHVPATLDQPSSAVASKATPTVSAPIQSVAVPASEAASAPTEPTAKAAQQQPLAAKSGPTVPSSTPRTDPPAEVGELWQRTLDEIKKQYNTLYGIARMAQPEFNGKTLTLSFKFAFHQKRLNEAKNRKIFADVVERIQGQPIEIICILADQTAGSVAKPDVSAISNIFGGAELLES